MRWLRARWLGFRSAKGFHLSASSPVCTSDPEPRCPALSFLILLPFALCGAEACRTHKTQLTHFYHLSTLRRTGQLYVVLLTLST